MKLEYLNDLTDNGKYPSAYPHQLIRLYDFTKTEAKQLIDMIHSNVIIDQVPFELSTVDFIKSINCSLKFQIDDKDYGIETPSSGNNFICRLTVQSFKEMIGYMEVFADETNSLGGYNWLYDPSENKIDLLFSPGGSW
jgi:hypothetical protein